MFGLLDDTNAEVRRAAVGEFRYRWEPHEMPAGALPKFVALLQDEDAEVRRGAAVALVKIGDVPSETIARLLRHKDIAVRHAAGAELLFNMREETKRFQAELLEFAGGDMEFCRANAALLSRAGPKSVPILVQLLGDRDPVVRGDAASALGELGPAAKEAAAALKRLLTDMAEIPHADLDDRVCHHAAAALNQVLGDKDYGEGLPCKRPDGK
jgi:HEAT repeat protein